MSGKSNIQPESKIPVLSPLRRTGSLRLATCSPIQENIGIKPRWKLNRHQSLQSLNSASSFANEQEDDADSVRSFSSTCSNVSHCDHAHFARNGTTFSGRCKRYVVHCSSHSTETDDYLTPTQRTNRTIRKLRNLLKDAQEEIVEKGKEILRLTKEVVELRLVKIDPSTESNDIGIGAGLGESMKNESQFSQVDNTTGSPHSRNCSSPVAYSLSDSGHYEDLNSSKENSHAAQSNIRLTKTLESLQKQHEDEIRELKEKHSDKVDNLLQRITDVNDRYYALRPLYEDCKKQIYELEKTHEKIHNNENQNIVKVNEVKIKNEELLQDKLTFMVKMKELESVKTEFELYQLNHDKLKVEYTQLKNREDELLKSLALKEEICKKCHKTHCGVSDRSSQTEDLKLRISHHGFSEENQSLQEQCEEKENGRNQEKESCLIPDLLNKLRMKQEELDDVKAMYHHLLDTRKDQPKHDPEMTLQFLKSAFYYFLTDKENAHGHLSAIESILGFTDNEKINIERAFLWR